MPSPPIMNLGSGMDTPKVIQQLLDLERMPYKRMIDENDRRAGMIKAWDEVRIRTRKLQDKSTVLYSFAGPFATRSVISSDPGAITGDAAGRLGNTSQEIEVKRLASRQQLHSDSVRNDEVLPGGSFTIQVGENKRVVRFAGGSMTLLCKAISDASQGSFEAIQVRVDENTSLLSMRTSQTGVKGRFQFTDENGILQKIGLLGKKSPEAEKQEGITSLPYEDSRLDLYNQSEFSGGTYKIISDQLLVKDSVAVMYRYALPNDKDLQIKLSTRFHTPEEQKAQDEKLILDSGIKSEYKGIELEGPKMERTKLADQSAKPRDGRFGIGLILKDGNGTISREIKKEIEKEESVWEEKIDLSQLSGGKEIVGFYIFAGKGQSLEATAAKILPKNAQPTQEGAFGPLHIVEEGEDAVLKIGGVEVKRPTNEKITDLIEGASLNLHRTTNGPAQVKVEVNSDDIVKKIGEWVEAYNDLLKFCRDNSFTADHDQFKANRPLENDKDMSEGIRSLQETSGIFSTDATVRALTDGMKIVSGSVYPSTQTPRYRVLTDVGISTGEVGSSLQDTKDGYLVLDESRLRQSISASPDAVKELFASDSNEDATPDHGVALKMAEMLKPYNRLSGGIISTRIDLLKTQIAETKDRINKKELSLKDKEQELRRRFGRMESSIQQSRETGKYLKGNLRSE